MRFVIKIIIGVVFWAISAFGGLAVKADMRNEAFLSSLTLIANEEKINVPAEEFLNWIDLRSHLFWNAKHKAEIENINSCPNAHVYCDLLFTHKDRLMVGKKTIFSVKSEPLRAYLDTLSGRLNKDPISATLHIEDEKVTVFSSAEKGLRLDIEKNIQIVSAALMNENESRSGKSREIRLAFVEIEPLFKAEDVAGLGINSLIGEGKSNFRGSPKNRIFNIKVAAKRFNGILIKPGEEFSFVNALGEVDGEHGYLPELVIKKNKTEPEFGGGICQVSTTTFRAAIWSGLKITERRNHAYPVSYYNPQGMDATVYLPKPDLRFINNTPGHILIQTKIEGTELTFQFYGTDDGRVIEIEGPKIIERKPDGSMKTVFTQIVKNKDGEKIIQDVFKSNYDSPSKYPRPGEVKLTEKPADWSKKQWEMYKKANRL